MLTLSFKSICMPIECWSYTKSGMLHGTANTLTVFFLQQGNNLMVEHSSSLLIKDAGCFVLADGPVLLHSQDSCNLLGISFEGEIAQQLCQQLADPFVISQPDCRQDTLRLFNQLWQSSLSMPSQQASSLSYSLLCALLEADSKTQTKNPIPTLVASAIALMQEHYGDVYGIEELAASLGVTKHHLIRTFTASIGTSPGRYLTSVRIENAKQLLKAGELSLQLIATLCGFSSAAYLCKVFKQEVGQTPSAWRNSLPTPAPHALSERELEIYL